MSKKIEIISNNKNETFKIGKLIGKILLNNGNGIILLSGDLGSGKTALVKGIAFFLGIKETITSPTFDILKSYQINKNKMLFYHIDAYRLKNINNIGLEEIINSDNCIVAIEWPEIVKKIIYKPFLEVMIKYEKERNKRKIIFNISGHYKEIIDVFEKENLFNFR